MSEFDEIQSILRERADLNARLSLLPYEGTPETKMIKGQKYLYIRKRVASKVTSTYVGIYSDDLYQALLRSTAEAKDLRKQIRKLEKKASGARSPGRRIAAPCRPEYRLRKSEYKEQYL